MKQRPTTTNRILSNRAQAGTAALLTASMLLAGCAGHGLLITPVSLKRELVETQIHRDSWLARDKIAVIDVTGIIRNTHRRQLFGQGEHPVSLLREQLEKARRDRAVKAVILRINSPGGTVTATELMHHEITEFRACGKPVVAVMMDVGASGGYYLACACDEIVAQRSTVTGSIGVLVQLFDLSGTMQMIGVRSEAITSGPRKDAGSPFRSLSPEERKLFQAIVDELCDGFVEVVARGRPGLDEEAVRKLADGRIYTATQALELGLIDRIATLREMIEATKGRIGADKVRVVMYRRALGYRPNYYAQAPAPALADVNLVNVELPNLMESATPQFMYLWQPGS